MSEKDSVDKYELPRDIGLLYPDVRMDSAYSIDYEGLYQDGYRGIIFDIDNTLVPHDAPADDKSIALFERLRGIGFKCILLSNNDEPRVKMFNDDVHADYIFKAHKPSPGGFIMAMEKMGTDTGNTLCIGDQLFTDMWGANAAGLATICTKKIYWRERTSIQFKRVLEAIVMVGYNHYRKHHGIKGRGKTFEKMDKFTIKARSQ